MAELIPGLEAEYEFDAEGHIIGHSLVNVKLAKEAKDKEAKDKEAKDKEDDEFESLSKTAKLAWATRRCKNPEKWGDPTEEDLKLLEEKNTRLGELDKIDTIVSPSSDTENLERIFLNEHRWYKIRISDKMKEKLKFLAIYETAPLSQIRYIGEIKEIKPFENSEYSEIILAGKPTRIEPIHLSSKNPHIAPQSHKYTTKSKIDKAKTLDDIF